MQTKLTDFLVQEDGAVTVDWVVLTAAIVLMAVLVMVPIAYGTTSLSTIVGGYITGVEVGD
jgi:hypothetical protein